MLHLQESTLYCHNMLKIGTLLDTQKNDMPIGFISISISFYSSVTIYLFSYFCNHFLALYRNVDSGMWHSLAAWTPVIPPLFHFFTISAK